MTPVGHSACAYSVLCWTESDGKTWGHFKMDERRWWYDEGKLLQYYCLNGGEKMSLMREEKCSLFLEEEKRGWLQSLKKIEENKNCY